MGDWHAELGPDRYEEPEGLASGAVSHELDACRGVDEF
jgi:hypothetical protein